VLTDVRALSVTEQAGAFWISLLFFFIQLPESFTDNFFETRLVGATAWI